MSTAAQHPHLTVVPPMPTAAPAPLEGVVVDKAPVALRSDSAVARAVAHVAENRGYLPLVGRGYRRIGQRWIAGYRDYHPHLIATAAQALAAEGDVAKQSALRDELEDRRAAGQRHRRIYLAKTSGWSLAATTAATAGTLTGGFWVTLATGLGAYLYGIRHGVGDEQTTCPLVDGPLLSGPAEAPSPGVRGVDDLVTALIKAGIITEAQRAETRILGGVRPDGPGWAATIELPEGMKAVEATSKVGELASALRKKGLQLEFKPDSSETAHEGMARLWVADSPTPYAGPKVYSELVDAPRWHFWRDGIPLGMDARQARQVLRLIWSSMLVGGLQDYGKSYLARLIAAAAALDPTVRIIVITGKTGPDWAPLKAIAHRYIAGSDPSTIREVFATMTSTIEEMQARGVELDRLFEKEPHKVPEGKITPELAANGMGPVLLIVEELQELLDGAAVTKMAMPDDESENPRLVSAKGPLVDLFARFNRLTRFVLGMGLYITQRPDADSVPTELREVCVKRACFRTKSPESSKMILGDLAVKAGAAPHALLESSKGIFVLDEGAEDGYRTLRGDVIDLPDFAKICERGRQLRIDAGTLTGDAAERAERDRRANQARLLSADCLAVMDAAGTDRIRTEDLLTALGKHDIGSYGHMTPEGLKELLASAGLGIPVSLGPMGDLKNPRGFKREAFARYA
ncbi:hypothetical protein ADK53_28735 [Streptomyces sp. WM6373]|uniref:hypothetical protein n=1 Tax=Streptomyces sp. WM6373 TaxID=1415556 RepID=UPI0006AF4D14|nr:hypothetical protein [Streptomyces sp. WM6373]KOU30207.1 hypothetical protein ADK53_28735 [Streptomyces sp. WM6373]